MHRLLYLGWFHTHARPSKHGDTRTHTRSFTHTLVHNVLARCIVYLEEYLDFGAAVHAHRRHLL